MTTAARKDDTPPTANSTATTKPFGRTTDTGGGAREGADRRDESRRRVLSERGDGFRLLRLGGDQLLGDGAVGERRGAGEQVVQSAAQPVHVGPHVHLVVVRHLLGGQVVGGAEHALVVEPLG